MFLMQLPSCGENYFTLEYIFNYKDKYFYLAIVFEQVAI